ncbi:MAG: DUF4234 domain-containing protein [Deltaproteobacteria bacterium]|nr:DUF4234 domain-containing protein [Deltaproteobacteria bacterium]
METAGEGLEKMDVVKLVFLTIITGGIYSAVWFVKRLNAINGMASPLKLSQGVFGFIIAGCIANWAMVLFLIFSDGLAAPETMSNISRISDVLGFLIEITLLLQVFKVRRIFMDHFIENMKRDVKFSWLWTFLFSIFYLQYRINRL